MRNLIFFIFIFISDFSLANKATPISGYSLAPLDEPVFTYAEVIVGTTTFNNWLNANYDKLNVQTMKGPREHLYYLITSYAYHLLKEENVVLPDKHDLILETLFSWSEKLGVYGSNHFYNKLKSEKLSDMPEIMRVAEKFEISAEDDMYNINSSKGSWSFKIPYYFMVWALSDFKAKNGMKTQLVSISTGASKDKSENGKSQATIMFVHTPNADKDQFTTFWINQLGLKTTDNKKDLNVKSLNSIHSFDSTSLLHKEATIIHNDNGSYFVSYLGMDGSYQKNRVHFVNFLESLNL